MVLLRIVISFPSCFGSAPRVLTAGGAILLPVACLHNWRAAPLAAVCHDIEAAFAVIIVKKGEIEGFESFVAGQHGFEEIRTGDALVPEGISRAGVRVDVCLIPIAGLVFRQAHAVQMVCAFIGDKA